MHKRAPLLRPRKKSQNGSSTASLNMSTAIKQSTITSNRGKTNRKISPMMMIVVVVIFLVGAGTYTKSNSSTEVETNVSPLKTDENVTSSVKNVPHDEPEVAISKIDADGKDDDEHYNHNYHLIFSTDCSAFQHWQSYLMFHSAYKVNQPGTITRIASGCSDEEGEEATKWHNENVSEVMGDQFKLHLTPHFSSVKGKDGEEKGDYKFFNKPFGLLHWLEHGIGFQEGSSELLNNPDDIVILIDPDMILLRPITGDFSNPRDVVIGKSHERERKYFVKHGAPFAQKYGLGTQWRTFNLDEIAGANSPAKDVSQADGTSFYPVGPPYLATVIDMYQIALKWTEFVPKVHKEYPHLLAEMFAFCIAAAHLGLKHQLLDSLMVSNVGSSRDEGWPMVDNITQDKESSLCNFASNADHSKHAVPSVIHYCQRYAIGEWFFGKRKMVKDFFECESPLMEFPPSDIIETKDYKKIFNDVKKDLTETSARREGFMTCAVLGALNDASIFFKEHSCKDVEANMEMATNLNK